MTRSTVPHTGARVLFTGSLCVLWVVFCFCAPASAQEDDGSSTLTSSTTTIVVVALTVGPVMTTSAVIEDKEQEVTMQVERYLRANPVLVQHALGVGAGEAARDLAALLGVGASEVAAFGRRLRTEREVLRALADPESLTRARARAFVRCARGRVGCSSVTTTSSAPSEPGTRCPW
ncbi:MAG: hypothetical protein AAGI01_02320 [Myxococcota bacterium]